jgi:hypothetical protein
MRKRSATWVARRFPWQWRDFRVVQATGSPVNEICQQLSSQSRYSSTHFASVSETHGSGWNLMNSSVQAPSGDLRRGR